MIGGSRVGKMRAVLEHAVVSADQLLAAAVRNPIVVMVGRGRVAEVRAMLDGLGGHAVEVQECTAPDRVDGAEEHE